MIQKCHFAALVKEKKEKIWSGTVLQNNAKVYPAQKRDSPK